MTSAIIVEACVESTEGALAAQTGGADRVELCAALLEGGLTPSLGEVEACRERLRARLHVMVRPRGGDFCYSDVEFEVMRRDIEAFKRLHVDGVVLGALTPDGGIDVARTGALLEQARPLAVTFHRAFDMTRDPRAALDTLVALGADRVLTSGQEPYALAGADLLADLVRQAGDRIVVMPGGGIDVRHVRRLVEATGAREIHVTGFATRESPMRYRNERCFMGGELRPPEFSRVTTDPERIARVREALRSP